MKRLLLVAAVLCARTLPTIADEPPPATAALPQVASNWKIDLAAEAPAILFPTAICAAPDGSVFVGSDPMDMPGPPTVPIDRIVRIKDGKVVTFADKLWSVMGIEIVDNAVYVVHAPYLSVFRDSNRDGQADSRVDLITGLGPTPPGFNGINDHIASGIRMGIDGYLYISIGDKGLPRAVGRDGTAITLFGGGVIRIRPDGTGIEVVSTGERNPLSVALSADDEIFTYGNDDDSKKWPNSLTHHVVGGHFGYPYQFLTAPTRALPIMTGTFGGSGTQGLCYNDDGLPDEYRGNLFFCDWGLQTVLRFEIKKVGATHAVTRRTNFVSRGELKDFRPFSLAVSSDGSFFWLVDWAFNGWLANGPKTGRIYRLSYVGPDRRPPLARPAGSDIATRLKALDHPALSARCESQRTLAQAGATALPPLRSKLNSSEPTTGRVHALWALDAIGGSEARQAITLSLSDASPRIRFHAARSVGIHRDPNALAGLLPLLADRDPAVRREAAIALGRLGQKSAAQALYHKLDESDPFVAWAIGHAIRQLEAWDKNALVAALIDPKRTEAALRLTDEAWALPVVEALSAALSQIESPAVRARVLSNIAGLYHRYPAWSGTWFGTDPLHGPFPAKTQDWTAEGMTAVHQALAAAISDRDASVRAQVIAGLEQIGSSAAPVLRLAMTRETDTPNLTTLAESLGKLKDPAATPLLAKLLADPTRPESARLAAIDALNGTRDPHSIRTRFALLYDPTAPATLVARALPELARAGFLPPNDLSGFFENPAPSVRAAAILSINVKKPLPPEIRQAVIDRLSDQDSSVRIAAMAAAAPLRLREAIPQIMAIAEKTSTAEHDRAITTLCAMPDPRCVSAYLQALNDSNPLIQSAAESALRAIKRDVADRLLSFARTNPLSPTTIASLNRVLVDFEPIRDWKVIGPFPRSTPRIFLGEPSIDFQRPAVGAGGLSIAWKPRTADSKTGRLDLEGMNRNSGQLGIFGYDQNGSPDLCAFGYAEVESLADQTSLMSLGSSGTLLVTVNEVLVYRYQNVDGRAYSPETDMISVKLRKGRNRILVQSRQGIGAWAFSVRVATAPAPFVEPSPARMANNTENLRRFAATHDGDIRHGEELFFDSKGVDCARCHSAGGRGTASIGPDLTGLAAKYDRNEIIRSVLEPSSRLAIGYQSISVATHDGKVTSGVIRSESATTLDLGTSQGTLVQIPKAEIEERRPSQSSIMPEGLVNSFTIAEFADLISYLSSLRQQNPSAMSVAK